MKDVTNNIHIT